MLRSDGRRRIRECDQCVLEITGRPTTPLPLVAPRLKRREVNRFREWSEFGTRTDRLIRIKWMEHNISTHLDRHLTPTLNRHPGLSCPFGLKKGRGTRIERDTTIDLANAEASVDAVGLAMLARPCDVVFEELRSRVRTNLLESSGRPPAVDISDRLIRSRSEVARPVKIHTNETRRFFERGHAERTL